MPLKAQPIGKLPDESGDIKMFSLSYPSLAHDYFHLPDTSDDELKSLYAETVFFKAVEAEPGDPSVAAAGRVEERRIAENRAVETEARTKLKQWSDREARGLLSDSERQERRDLEDKLAVIRPSWLLWPERESVVDETLTPAELAERAQPRVLAEFDNNVPFLIERSLGRGRVLFAASGLFSNWNTLPKTNTILLFDRLLRGMLARTLPDRNPVSAEQISIPVIDRNGMYTLRRPDAGADRAPEILPVDALGADVYGVTLNNLTARGIYTITAVKGDTSADPAQAPAKLWEVILAVNGPARESEPAVIDAAELAARMGDANYRWVGRGERISIAGAQVSFQNLWKWLLLLVLIGLLAEMAVLARPIFSRRRAA
jgi:hypothetical protein